MVLRDFYRGFLVLLLLSAACVHRAGPTAAELNQHFVELAGDSQGVPVSGKVVLVDFWASWCEPCMAAVPFYQSLSDTYGAAGFVVIGINLDADRAPADTFLQRAGIRFPVIYDAEGKWAKRFALPAMPTSYLFDQSGNPVARYDGFAAEHKERIERDVRRLLGQEPRASRSENVMGTTFRVELVPKTRREDEAALASAFAIIRHVDAIMSEWQETSALSQVSRNAGVKPVRVPDELFAVLKAAKDVSRNSSGAFDVTWAALWDAWRFDADRPQIPDSQELAKRTAKIDWRDLHLDESMKTAFLARKGMQIGLGAIAKGYALDRVGEELSRRGYRDYLLDAGGQILAHGSPSAKPWAVGIRHPRGGVSETLATVNLHNESIATSGDYERFFELDGTRYHHILDVKSGLPAREARSVSVITRDGMRADAYSTASFILGPRDALQLAEKLKFDLLLIDAAGCPHLSEGFKKRLSQQDLARMACDKEIVDAVKP